MSFTFVTYADLYSDVLKLIPRLPQPISAVFGVPRSGMIPAAMIATELHVPLGMVGSDFVGAGFRVEDRAPGHILVIDDSVFEGSAMARARATLAQQALAAEPIFASVYMTPGAEDHVNVFGRYVPHPRIFQWNLFNSWAMCAGMVDMDGVLCLDPTVWDDDGPEYQACLRDATPLHIPTVQVGSIVTNRIERWRGITEAWLDEHGVKYGQLIMQPFETAVERRANSNPAGYKASHYLASEAPIFIESHDVVADELARLTGKPVISLESASVFQTEEPPESPDNSAAVEAYGFAVGDLVTVAAAAEPGNIHAHPDVSLGHAADETPAPTEPEGLVDQFAEFLHQRTRLDRRIDVPRELIQLLPTSDEHSDVIAATGLAAGNAVVVCKDVLEDATGPERLLRFLDRGASAGGVGLIVERDAEFSPDAPRTLEALSSLFANAGVSPAFMGRLAETLGETDERRLLTVLDSRGAIPTESAPDGFLVTAIMAAFNEADIIESTVDYLTANGVRAYVLDNWSTDGTYELLERMLAEGKLVGLERLPIEGAPGYFTYMDILNRQEALARELDTDWVIRHDVDERRSSPWPGVKLRDALYHVDRRGFSAVDHTLINFRPIDDSFEAGMELEDHFRHFEFEEALWGFTHVKAWRKTEQTLGLAERAGHDVDFHGKWVFPYKFLLKHYPVRSQEHGERKILGERHPRWDPATKGIGWHTHYDHIHAGHNFLRDPADLILFDTDHFFSDYLVQRLAAIGVTPRLSGVPADTTTA